MQKKKGGRVCKGGKGEPREEKERTDSIRLKEVREKKLRNTLTKIKKRSNAKEEHSRD